MSKSKEQFISDREDQRVLDDSDYEYQQYLKQLYLNNHNNKKHGESKVKEHKVQK